MASSDLDQYFPGGDGECTKVFETLCRVVTNDPGLANVPITWRLWRGEPGESTAPSERELPWVRLTPVASRMHRAEEGAWLIEFAVKFEICVAGTRFRDLGNLVSCFYLALRTNRPFEDITVFKAFRNAGASSYEFRTAGIAAITAQADATEPSRTPPMPVVDQVSAGLIIFQVFVSSID